MSHRNHYPRPEYPRPEKQRGLIEGIDWINLNGPWQFRFDPERRGLRENWFSEEAGDWHDQIIVPFCWESLSAWGQGNAASNENYYSTRIFVNPLEVTRANHRTARRFEVGWYRREIRIPKEWLDGRRVILHVGAADFFTDAWCNGVSLGRHEGGYTPFEFDITDALQDRRGLIVFRVEDPMDNHEQPVGKQWQWYTTVSGIWQTVFVEPRAPAHIARFKIRTEIATGKVTFELDCQGAEEKAPLEVAVTSPAGELSEATTTVANGRATCEMRFFPVELWEPDTPHLYRVVFRLRGEEGGPIDVLRTYFGMREITTSLVDRPGAPAALTLNNRPIYLRGALYQSYYPDGVYTAGDAQTLRDDIAFAKKAGFQFLRIHIKLDDPLFLYYADTMGILLMEDFPNFGEGGDTPLGRRRFEEMMRRGIERDRNHPSLIAWCLFNETWGFGGQVELIKHFGPNAHALLAEPSGTAAAVRIENRSAQQWVQQMWELAKSLDDTRLVEDMSVVHWEHLHYFAHGDTDINSWHFYIDDYAKAKAHIEGVVEQTYAGSRFNYEEGYAQGHQPLINSEFGGIGALDGDRDISWSFKFLTNELRRHESLSAYIFTELHDVEWEYNGFLNYDRTAKEFGYDPNIVNQGDVLPIDAPPIQQCRPGEPMRIAVYASHYSRHHPSEVMFHWRLSGIDGLGRVTQDLDSGRKPIPFRHHRVDLADVVEFTLPDRLMLCTLWVFAISGEGVVLATNFVQFFVMPGEPIIRQNLPDKSVLRALAHDWTRAEWSGDISSREKAVALGQCYGYGHGFFEWELEFSKDELARAKRLRLLCEASSRRIDHPQTDSQRHPTTFEMLLNGVRVHHAVLPDHPHDSRGALSYLSGGYGGYGYLAEILAEGELLKAIRDNAPDGKLLLNCGVPADARVQGGLSIYGARSGRFPTSLTVIAEW